MSGGVSFNFTWHEASPNGHRTAGWSRIGGRVAVPVSTGIYVGVSLASWVREGQYVAPHIPVEVIASRSEALLHSAYGQVYMRALGLHPFLRGGLGVARTETFLPAGGVIDRHAHWRTHLEVGGGVEVRLARHLYLGPSVDYGRLLSTDREVGELRRGLTLGLGLTVR